MNQCLESCVVVPEVANTANITLTGTQPFINAGTEVILSISDINNLLQDEQAILSVTDGVNVVPLEDKHGYNIRADRLVSRAYNMPGGLPRNSSICIKVRVATDPARLVCFTPLRRSSAQRPATTAGTATGTGINLD